MSGSPVKRVALVDGGEGEMEREWSIKVGATYDV